MAHVAVMAAGSWGTTFAKILADAGNTVRMWARREKVVEDINVHHMNPDYLPDVPLLSTITATANPLEALDGAEMVVLAVPSQTLRDNLADWAPHIGRDVTVISLMKGVELGTLKRMSEVIHEVGKVDFDRIAVVTGPNLAKEIASEQPTAAVVACIDAARAERVQDVITTKYFRPYTNTDVVGCELGGAIKNVIGLAFGMASGMGLGDNTKATLITRGLAEAIRLGSALGADPLTFSGLAGLGDLVATCVSPLSRNHTFGVALGRGRTLAEAQEITRQTAEGVKSCRSIRDLARAHDVEMPITEQVEKVCYEGLSPRQAVAELMSRDTKSE
ncbi:Glycerol-3-phosphate dehydrogenase (NAD(P)(+)) [Stackebrandtia nassauensis DSM 44728]|uniref:Glycerol-3-phosphate dehydrogenase [NAD(P)+] n=2 Tax=Stackebrandtia TaxID=283810 RepID=D3Q9T0_STANL|nr:NAD(P)H-dependent glycerol-3-phosphate dehydrogenase [Stackebrandtia nassauensis]ADD44626.1 Glycerol-3-phosphate dehydrogenase (NAD(P)(+)) [Stackebrandtia nassauensis DSM 44728]